MVLSCLALVESGEEWFCDGVLWGEISFGSAIFGYLDGDKGVDFSNFPFVRDSSFSMVDFF